MTYIIFEIQENQDGTIGTLIETADGYNQASSVYHLKLSSAAVSTMKTHTVVMMTVTGGLINEETFTHQV